MCSVVGCESWRRSAQRFKLPEDPERRLEWVQFLFEINGQRLKESCCTDITICSEHFSDVYLLHTFPSGSIKLRSGAVPSMCVKTKVEELEEPVETAEITFLSDELVKCESPSSCTTESGLTSQAAPQSPALSDASNAFMSDYSQMLQKVANIDMVREKAGLLQMKGKYVVNEKRLLQLFSPKCPLCGGKIKIEKFTYGVLIVLNQQCLQCEYRNQWKSQVNASVPAAEDPHLAGGVDVTPEIQEKVSTGDNQSSITGVYEVVTLIDDECDAVDEEEESDDVDDMDSDEDWTPMDEFSADVNLHNDEPDEESDRENDDDSSLAMKNNHLCTECGKFFNRWRPHTCRHKVRPFSCNICGKRFVNEASLNSHSRVHDVNYRHECKYCYVTFKTKVDKISHEQNHVAQEKPYKCHDCSETFATFKERKIHLADHTGPPQLKCDICGIEFYRSINLRRHLVVHTGARPFKCVVCQRGFNQASHLKSHVRLHTGEKPFECQHCDKRFNHNVSLKSHVQRYHMPHSGCEPKKGQKRKTVTEGGLDNIKESDKEQKAQKERKDKVKKKWRSTGRPIGRPKRSTVGKTVLARRTQGQCKTDKGKAQTLKCSDEDSVSELTESDISFDAAEEEEEEMSEKMAPSTGRVRGRANKNCDSDPDFEPEDKKKRCSS